MTQRLRTPPRQRPPLLEIEQILAWADAYYARTGAWPRRQSGFIPEAARETWSNVDQALYKGIRGLPGGSSLARLLAMHRQVRNLAALPPLTIEQILAWADLWHQRTGDWPTATSGPIPEAPGETWTAVHLALSRGRRGLPSGSTLPQLLEERRGVRNHLNLPPLAEGQILAWADAYHERSGEWPKSYSGVIEDAPGESWSAVDGCLKQGHRGLPAGSSLAELLAERRGARYRLTLPELSAKQILAWADAHRQRRGCWPSVSSGPIEEAPGETWSGVNTALERGLRGLPGDSSLARLLAKRRRARNQTSIPPLTIERILAWADAHHGCVGKWPTAAAGAIAEAPGETWLAVDMALRKGSRGLPAGSSLARLLRDQRGVRIVTSLPPLTVEQVLRWADAHHQRTGKWPARTSGPLEDGPGETWASVNTALIEGHRGLPGRSSLARLLAEHRGVKNIGALPPLTVAQILAWADACHQRTGSWPTAYRGGRVAEAPDERWDLLDQSLRKGLRGLPPGLSLARLLAQERGVPNRKAS
jgi:hypothetical protein